jgi:hypothetical protein
MNERGSYIYAYFALKFLLGTILGQLQRTLRFLGPRARPPLHNFTRTSGTTRMNLAFR